MLNMEISVSCVRTTRFGLKGLKIEGAKLWENIPNNIKDIKDKKYFNVCFKKHMVDTMNIKFTYIIIIIINITIIKIIMINFVFRLLILFSVVIYYIYFFSLLFSLLFDMSQRLKNKLKKFCSKMW